MVDSAVKTFTDNATIGAVLHAVVQGVTGMPKIPKVVNSAFKYALKNVPKEEIAATLDANVKSGNITPETALKTMEDIDGYNAAIQKTSEGLSPETRASVAGLIQARDNLIKEMLTKDETQRQVYADKIDIINNQIKKITETGEPLKYETDDVTGKPLNAPPEVKGEPENISKTHKKQKILTNQKK